jgi:RNA polymerase sigma-70 factor (ECF subfamily)
MARNTDPDEKLIRTYLVTGETRLLGILIGKYGETVYRFCARFLGDPDDAADCSQEVFIRVFVGIGGFRFRSKFSTWLYRIMLNVCRETARYRTSRGKATPYQEMPAWSVENPEEVLERKEINEVFQKALGRLKSKHRNILIMRDVEGMSYQEISDITGLRPGTVRSALARARHRVAVDLKDYRYEK